MIERQPCLTVHRPTLPASCVGLFVVYTIALNVSLTVCPLHGTIMDMATRGRQNHEPLDRPDPAIVKKLLGHLKKGVPRKYAAIGSGIGERTFRRYITWGKRGKSKEWVAFLAAVKKAEAESVCEDVANIHRASRKQWQASAWKLERRRPEDFASERRELAELRKQLAELAKQIGEMSANVSDPPETQQDSGADGGDRSEPSKPGGEQS